MSGGGGPREGGGSQGGSAGAMIFLKSGVASTGYRGHRVSSCPHSAEAFSKNKSEKS